MSHRNSKHRIRAEQVALLDRIDQIVHWQKRDLRYRGSKDTAELGGMVAEKLVRRDTYKRTFMTRPHELFGLLRRLTRHAIIDVMRAAAAEKHQRPLLTPPERWARTPSIHRQIERRDDLDAIRRELERFRTGESQVKVARPELRANMATAFELHHFGGDSHACIAERLNTSKATIGNWLEFMRLHLARRVAERERCAARVNEGEPRGTSRQIDPDTAD